MARLLFLFPLLFFACQNDSTRSGETSPESSFDKKQTEVEVRQMFDDYHAAIEREGFAGEFPYLDTSDDFYWVPPGFTSALDFDSVKVILNQSTGLFKSAKFHWEALQVYPLSNDVATYTGIVGGEMVDTSDQIIPVSIIESGTLIKRTDGWKLLCGQSRNLKADEH